MSGAVAQSKSTTKFLAAAGIAGPVLYVVAWLVLGALDPDYSQTRDPISNLSAVGAPHALVMTVVIFVFAVLIILFAYGLRRGLPPGLWMGPAALVIAGVGYIGIGVAPLDLANLEEANLLHTLSATITVFGLILAPLLCFPSLRRHPEWRNVLVYSIATTAVGLALVVLASSSVFAGWDGLMQRLVLAVALIWMIVIAIRLLRPPALAST